MTRIPEIQSGLDSVIRSGGEPFRVLIVDDQSLDIMVPRFLTHQLGYQATLAFDGRTALERMAAETFDVIILDWNMPILDGHEFLVRLETRFRGQEKGLRVENIILYSGDRLNFEDFDEALSFKIIDVWRKPMNPLDLLKRLRKIKERVVR